MTITIDGTSGSGKTTIGTRLAKQYKLPFCDTGLIFRAITYFAVLNKISTEEVDKIIDAINGEIIDFDFEDELVIKINGRKVSYEELHDDINISPKVPEYAHILKLKDIIINIEKKLGEKGAVMVGRNLGREVLPNADVKFFVDTAPSIRAIRRYKDIGGKLSLQEIMVDLVERDHTDMSSDITPLYLTDEHIVIDNSGDFEKVIAKCISIIEKTKN